MLGHSSAIHQQVVDDFSKERKQREALQFQLEEMEQRVTSKQSAMEDLQSQLSVAKEAHERIKAELSDTEKKFLESSEEAKAMTQKVHDLEREGVS